MLDILAHFLFEDLFKKFLQNETYENLFISINIKAY